MMRVLIVDAHAGVRSSMVGILSDEPDIEVEAVGTARQAGAAVADRPPDVVLLDAALPDATGAEACAMLRARHGPVPVIVMSGFPWQDRMLDALEVGARGFVIKGADPAVMRHAVRSVAGGGTFVDARATGRLIDLALKNSGSTESAGPHPEGSDAPADAVR